MSGGKDGSNWDYANDCPLTETLRKRLARERAIARFDGATTPPAERDAAWIARELGDVEARVSATDPETAFEPDDATIGAGYQATVSS